MIGAVGGDDTVWTELAKNQSALILDKALRDLFQIT